MLPLLDQLVDNLARREKSATSAWMAWTRPGAAANSATRLSAAAWLLR